MVKTYDITNPNQDGLPIQYNNGTTIDIIVTSPTAIRFEGNVSVSNVGEVAVANITGGGGSDSIHIGPTPPVDTNRGFLDTGSWVLYYYDTDYGGWISTVEEVIVWNNGDITVTHTEALEIGSTASAAVTYGYVNAYNSLIVYATYSKDDNAVGGAGIGQNGVPFLSVPMGAPLTGVVDRATLEALAGGLPRVLLAGGHVYANWIGDGAASTGRVIVVVRHRRIFALVS